MADDPVLDRLRAADPAHAVARLPVTRGAVRRARRRRRRSALPAACVPLAVVVAGVLVPGGAAPPAAAEVAARAAASLPSGAGIQRVRSELVVSGLLRERITTWTRTDASGRIVAVRRRVDDAQGEHVLAGLDEAATLTGRRRMTVLDPRTGRVTSTPGAWMEPPVTARAGSLLRAVRDGRRRGTVAAARALGPRRVVALDLSGARGRRETLLLDARSDRPVELRVWERPTGRQPDGYRYRERITSVRRLPDTAANRRLLRVGG